MGKILVIAEKSSAGQDIARVLGLTKSNYKNGYMENDNYVVGWARGHLVGQKQPVELYDEKEAWQLSVIPFKIDQDKDLKILNDKGAREIFNTLKTLINRNDIDYIVNAGDSGREGELIQQWIYKMAGNKHEIKRLWTSSLTDESIKKAFNNLRPNSEYKNLYEEGKALKIIDWMYGMSYTVLMTNVYGHINGKALHYGRCQTPLLNLIVSRENEIKNFTKEIYYNLQVDYGTFNGNEVEKSEKEAWQIKNIKLTTEEEKKNLLSKWDNVKNSKVILYEQKDKETKAPRCFSLNTLQQYLGKKYYFTPEKTLEIAQSLYEKKITTYPRTNSEYLTTDIWNEKEKHIDSIFDLFNEYTINKNIALDKSYVDDSKVEDHHAIIPTEIKADINSLSEEEKIAYMEICKRYLSIFMDTYKYKDTTIITEMINNKNETSYFMTKGKVEIDIGYKVLYSKDVVNDEDKKAKNEDKEIEEYNNLPKFNQYEVIPVSSFTLKEKETKPKTRFNVGSIIKLMEQYCIGTPATRSEIIKKLIDSGVVELKNKGKNKEYVPTEMGIKYIELIPEYLKNPDLSKQVEEKIAEVGKGKKELAFLQEEIYTEQLETIKKVINEAKNNNINIFSSKEVIGKCPLCGKDIVETQKAYSHKEYKENKCPYVIWKNSLYTNINKNMAQELLEKGKTIGTFTSKDNKKYKQEIIYDKAQNKLIKGEYINDKK